MLVWLFALVTVLLVTPVLFALAYLAKRLTRQQRQGFARRAAPDTTAVDIPAWTASTIMAGPATIILAGLGG